MKNITTGQILNADFRISAESPVLRPRGGSIVVADPSMLTPDVAHDGKWHMFFHTTFGVCHAESTDGIKFSKPEKIAKRAMRPNINFIDGRYYLFYERTRPVIFNLLSLVGAKWESEIYCVESTDFTTWSKAYPVIRQTRDYA